MNENVFPDCRAQRNEKTIYRGAMGEWKQVYCAQCYKPGPVTPQESTFIFWMCDPCFEANGHITGTYVVPDQVFWQKVLDEQMEQYGKLVPEQVLQDAIASNLSPLATLLKEGK